ncbi:UV damage repair endonuclease [Methylorubrum extorquens]|uniref:UV damage repair endonuclease n=1 Tax=Methylorubrum extorquens TaxID=408 RepID=UPI00015904B6|nr:UV damage repair endonuclease [Methylorubrum extorquens]ABY29935.1 UV damage repair endonuclease [Methylorubrum extorquens PA1]KQP92594.1 UV damage repair endonuclease UvdE [Methylobacterium sp. Leaf119]WIU41253.1 UV damage endonuclease UvsE [Methylorubrum extorquens]
MSRKPNPSQPNIAEPPRLGFCCTFIPDPDPAHKTLKAAKDAAKLMNLGTVTMAHLERLGPTARFEKLEGVVRHNLAALERQIAWVSARPPLERLLRMASSVLPGYTHPVAEPLYAQAPMRALIEAGLARIGEQARAGDVRLSMHPGPFCIIASRNPNAQKNGIAELEYHAEVMAMLGYGSGWHPHGAHVNIHIGGREPGIEGFRESLSLISETARNLLTVENDESLFGLDAVLRLGDRVPVVLDLHHHWVESRGVYIEPDDPRIPAVIASWRGVRPVSHISVSRETVLPEHDTGTLPDYAALSEQGHSWRDLAAHSDLMWNEAVNALVARHLAWTDFEIEAKGKNQASVPLAARIGREFSQAAA